MPPSMMDTQHSLRNGHSSSRSNSSGGDSVTTKPTSKRKLSSPTKTTSKTSTSSPFWMSSRVVAALLVSLAVVTLVVDMYMLLSKDFSFKRIVHKNQLPDLHGNHRGGAIVKRPVRKSTTWTTSRHFKFQDENAVLPVLRKQNKKPTTTERDTTTGKEPILQVFKDAGIPPLNATMIELLPTWEDIVRVIGPRPIIGGLDTCDRFKESVPAVERMLGSSGMFNTGTNLVTHLLKNNCKIPERVEKYGWEASREMHGMRWQVPWGKHSPAKYKKEHSTKKAKDINKEWIMPVVTIRHPYSWMNSMCKNGYTSKWKHQRRVGRNCPNLKLNGEWNEVTTHFADNRLEYSDSLAHLWNDWYKMYLDDFQEPRLIVRLEDLVFHAKETTTTICTCVGGKIRTDRPFTYVLDSAKADSRGHDTSTGFIQAWIKYSKPMPPQGGFSSSDYYGAMEALNEEYMKRFHYQHPPPA